MKIALRGNRSNAGRLPSQADVAPDLIDISRPVGHRCPNPPCDESGIDAA
jgi:hypothetical protein